MALDLITEYSRQTSAVFTMLQTWGSESILPRVNQFQSLPFLVGN